VAVETQNSHLLIEMRGDAQVAPLVSLLVGTGAQVEEVNKDKASLEEVFLSLVESKE
jgi:hypothetical protein